MAITTQQRTIALDLLLQAYPDDNLLGQLLPGVTAPQVVQAILTAMAGAADAQLTQILVNAVANGGTQVTALQNRIAAIQAQTAQMNVV